MPLHRRTSTKFLALPLIFLVVLWAYDTGASAGDDGSPGSESLFGVTPTPTDTATATPTASPACSPAGTPHVLYSQNNDPAPTPGGVISQEADYPFETAAADDFVVPAGETWYVTQVVVVGEYNVVGFPASNFDVSSILIRARCQISTPLKGVTIVHM